MKASYWSTFGLLSNTVGWRGYATSTMRKETRDLV